MRGSKRDFIILGWDYKDDLTFLKYDNSKVKLKNLLMQSFIRFFNNLAKKRQVYSCRESWISGNR